ncbi:MAG: hypothetical protein JOY68_07490 [Candidatus Dormibacteraeota bacterium]|nr:hypothetical protein [Candidatus Dormibacteraeota bacterium]
MSRDFPGYDRFVLAGNSSRSGENSRCQQAEEETADVGEKATPPALAEALNSPKFAS